MSRYLGVSSTDHQTITTYRTQSGRCDRHEAAKADIALRLRRHPTPLSVAQGKHGIGLIMVDVLNIHERDVQDAPSLCLIRFAPRYKSKRQSNQDIVCPPTSQETKSCFEELGDERWFSVVRSTRGRGNGQRFSSHIVGWNWSEEADTLILLVRSTGIDWTGPLPRNAHLPMSIHSGIARLMRA